MRKLADEQAQYDDGQRTRITVPAVYERIKRSNSSLNRKSKKLLEDSIERVLSVMKDEDGSSDDLGSIEGEFDGIEVSEPKVGDHGRELLFVRWHTSALFSQLLV